MEEAQYSEDLFSTQDNEILQEAGTSSLTVSEKHTEDSEGFQPSENENNTVEKQGCAPADTDTPDLVFSEDMDFGKPSESVDASSKALDPAGSIEELVDASEVGEGTEVVPSEVIESCIPAGNQDTGSNAKDLPEERLAQFPFARVKQIMKLDPEVNIVSAEAIFLVTKAAELFLQTLAKDASSHTLESKKKTISKRDVEIAIDNVDSLIFLEGMMNV